MGNVAVVFKDFVVLIPRVIVNVATRRAVVHGTRPRF